jgi:hypothetical protein
MDNPETLTPLGTQVTVRRQTKQKQSRTIKTKTMSNTNPHQINLFDLVLAKAKLFLALI